jgi:hypothetical protein
MVHVAGLSDDQLVDELLKVKKELHEAYRRIELLEYELELAQRKRSTTNVAAGEETATLTEEDKETLFDNKIPSPKRKMNFFVRLWHTLLSWSG